MKNNIRKIILIIFLSLIVSSCASNKDDKKDENIVTSYNKAFEILKDKRYSEAAEKFEKLYDDFPLSKWSIKGQAMAVYAYFADEKFDEVIRLSESFVQMNPSSEYVPYVQYMKSLSYFKMIPNVDRGQNYTKLASANFRELIARFPNSQYVDDAREKIALIDERLAAAKMSVGRYQLTNQNYIGSIIHFEDVTHQYPNSKQAAEAYFRLYEIYYKLGMKTQSDMALEKLSSYKDPYWNSNIIKN